MNLKLIRHIVCRVLLPHISIVLSGMLAVLLAIDRVNSSMMFIDHRITKGLMLVLCIVGILNSMQLLTRPHRQPEARRAEQSAHTAHTAHPPYAAPVHRDRPGSGRTWM